MSQEKITIKINKKGELVLETNGIMGPACMEEAKKLLEKVALITEVNKTDEFYQQATVKVKQNSHVEVGK